MSADNQAARQHTENAVARLAFARAIPLTDPMTNPPHRPIPTGGEDPEHRRHLRLVDEALEVDGYAEAERQDEVVRFARRRGPSGGAA